MEASAEGFNQWEMVDADFFVPHREGLPPTINQESSEVQENGSTTAPSSPAQDDQEDSEQRSPVLDNSEIFKRLFNCWIGRLTARVWDAVCLRSGLWAFGSVTTAMLAAALMWLAAARVQSWRRRAVEEKSRLVLLITEKEQKITQLLVDIGKMNELLMARRKVTVLRIRESPRLIT